MTAGIVLGAAEAQLAVLQSAFPGALVEPLANALGVVTLPSVLLPAGWNRTKTFVRFVLPSGYPMARPDCFYADPGLRLAAGTLPTSSAVQPIPGLGQPLLWFSWHLTGWNPAQDSLLSYARTVQRRLADPR
jgi:Prokaryotic E2 family E